jgi:VanZ family protein
VRELRYRRAWLACGALMVVIVTLGSVLPNVPSPAFSPGDKFNHLIAYVGLTAWFTALVHRRRYLWVVAGLTVFGLGVEAAQATMGLGRSGEWRDLIANSLGIVAGLAIAYSSRESWLARFEGWLARWT